MSKEQNFSPEERLLCSIFGTTPEEQLIHPTTAASPESKTRLRETLAEVLTVLTEREQKVLELRFGLGQSSAQTLDAVGKQFYVTRERIRQIGNSAMGKMRTPACQEKLRQFIKKDPQDGAAGPA